MVISLLIRTKNEAKAINKTLELIKTQRGVSNLEIIVVDSGSTDDTISIIRHHRDREVKLIEIKPEDFTFGRALNIGFKVSQGEVVVPLSAHAFLCNEHWLENLTKHFMDPQVAGVYGRQLPHPEAWPPVKRDYLQCYSNHPRVQKNPNDIRDHFFSNVNAAVRRKCWEEHPFVETLPYCEDWEWARAMLRKGYKIIYEPEAAVYHSHNESLLEVCSRSYREALAKKLLYPEIEVTVRKSFKIWYDAVAKDISFISQKKEDRRWILWTLIYRLFWTYGILHPYMPAAIWRPLLRRLRKLGGK